MAGTALLQRNISHVVPVLNQDSTNPNVARPNFWTPAGGAGRETRYLIFACQCRVSHASYDMAHTQVQSGAQEEREREREREPSFRASSHPHSFFVCRF